MAAEIVTAPAFNDLLVRSDNVRVLAVAKSFYVTVTVVIDWSVIPEKFMYAGMDKSGIVYAFTDKPHKTSTGYQKLIGEAMLLAQPYTNEWAETLQRRDEP